MKSKKNVVFLGMMGSGKTSIGSLVAKKINFDFIDVDQKIESKVGMSISEIFKIKGEEYFRKVEENITLEILRKNNTVISLGGGGFLNNNIRKEILNNHISFWLKWSSKTLIKRIKDSSKRPIALKLSHNQLIELIKKRSTIYSKSLYKIECENLTKNQILKEFLNIYDYKKIKY